MLHHEVQGIRLTLSEVRRCKITEFMLECSSVEIYVSLQFLLEKEDSILTSIVLVSFWWKH